MGQERTARTRSRKWRANKLKGDVKKSLQLMRTILATGWTIGANEGRESTAETQGRTGEGQGQGDGGWEPWARGVEGTTSAGLHDPGGAQRPCPWSLKLQGPEFVLFV